MIPTQFAFSELADKLTIIIVARNLATLHYPLVESLWSAIPLGCRFLVGLFSCDDNTADYYYEMRKFVPIDMATLAWRHGSGLTSIGIATQELLELAPTPFAYNLQANEIVCPDGVESIFKLYEERKCLAGSELCQAFMSFRHFWGNCQFEATIGGHAYCAAQRLLDKTCDMSKFDGSYSTNAHGPQLGFVHRYSYCFRNQIMAKTANHERLFGDNQANQLANIEWCKQRPNYSGYHPPLAQHLLQLTDYDRDASLRLMQASLKPL